MGSLGKQAEIAPPAVQKAYSDAVKELFDTEPTLVTYTSSKWEKYSQTHTIMNPVQITLPISQEWRDMKTACFEFEVLLTRTDGVTPLVATDLAYPINNSGHGFIKSVQCTIGSNSVTSSHTEHWAIEHYMDRKVNFSPQERGEMTIEGWYEDTPGRGNVTDPRPTLAAGSRLGHAHWPAAVPPTPAQLNNWMTHLLSGDRLVTNNGATRRHALSTAGVAVKYIVELAIPCFNSGRLLPPGMEMTFRIFWNSPEMALMSDAASPNPNPKFKIIEHTPKIIVKTVVLSPDVHLSMEQQALVQGKMGVFPHLEQKTLTFTIVNGRRDFRVHDVWTGKVPNYMLVYFMHGAAMIGSYTRSMTYIGDMNQSSLRVTRGMDELPFERIKLNDRFKEEGYNTLLKFSGQPLGASLRGITREDYMNGDYYQLFNFNPDGELNYNYNYGRNTGSVGIDVEFSADTDDNTTMVVMGWFEQEGWIDSNKIFALRFQY